MSDMSRYALVNCKKKIQFFLQYSGLIRYGITTYERFISLFRM